MPVDGPRTADAYARPIDTNSTTITFSASDGAVLRGDLFVPTGPDGPPTVGVVVAHPHPQYGGDRFHPVVDAITRRVAENGAAALRFDFRAEFDDGTGERLDVLAAAERLRSELAPGGSLVLAGYSFGAAMVLSATSGDGAVHAAALALVAPPFAMFRDPPAPGHGGPTLALVPERDQFGPPDTVSSATSDWPDVSIDVIERADHFLMGAAADVGERVTTWIETALAP